ncbi:LolA family protein [Myroides sp. LJL115]
MKKLIIYSILSLFSITTTFAQSSQRAKNYLQEVSNKVKNYQNVSLDFSYNSIEKNDLQPSFQAKGQLDLQKDLYKLEFMDVTKIFDGKKVYTISEEDMEVTVSNYSKENTNALLPSDLLDFFQSGFDFQWDTTAMIQGKKIQYIKLLPTDKNSTIDYILLGIEDATKNIYTKVQMDKNGTKSTLVVNSFQSNQPMSKNHFTFTPSAYSDYYINKID